MIGVARQGPTGKSTGTMPNDPIFAFLLAFGTIDVLLLSVISTVDRRKEKHGATSVYRKTYDPISTSVDTPLLNVSVISTSV